MLSDFLISSHKKTDFLIPSIISNYHSHITFVIPVIPKPQKVCAQKIQPSPAEADAVRMLFQGDGVEADAAYALRFLQAAAEKAMGRHPGCGGVIGRSEWI